ncbi:hypothetical protein IHE45_19G023900 [Dioscorea alata]|uniref:Uncharacterized protein n=2 Tax=Dioscorea alata TaxID=55571 RepID=A0ACB7TWW0_DIOAL|nr:hypothetical protein IHE45_19G023900 [Dioscorea alata]KAH7652536.1 hypothetical protein IHE45_19G023900 [Dioscorea alata]
MNVFPGSSSQDHQMRFPRWLFTITDAVNNSLFLKMIDSTAGQSKGRAPLEAPPTHGFCC